MLTAGRQPLKHSPGLLYVALTEIVTTRMKSFYTTLITLLLGFTTHCSNLYAQKGAQDIYRDMEKLGVLANVLYVAAHPDDENTRLISYLSNHLSVHTTYLSMTRGDGGQNLIGPEIREMLGLIRTYELLGARSIDGGDQRFTRANDFGYSKTPAETFQIWNREDVLSDVVWAIRNTQPDVIINRFNTDTSRPNHGHHTASAILSVEAFDLAGKTTSYPEQLSLTQPWQPRRIFWNTSWWFYGSQEAFAKVDKSRMLGIDIGSFDPITGESNSEIAGRSRSMHKSQGFGSAETRGESLDYIELIKDANGTIPSTLFDGIDITWNRLEGGALIAQKVRELQNNYDFKSPSRSVPALLDIYKSISALPESNWKKIKLTECENLIWSCLGLFAEVRCNIYKTEPDAPLNVFLEVINRSDVDVQLLSMQPSTGDSVITFSMPLAYNQGFQRELTIMSPHHLSIPYWLDQHPTEGMYVVEDQKMRGLPANPPELTAKINLSVLGTPLTLTTPVIYKTVDPAEGEITRPISTVPPVTVVADNEVLVFEQGIKRTVTLSLTAVQDSIEGQLHLKTSKDGWKVTPENIAWTFTRAGESKTIECTITPPDQTSTADLLPVITINGTDYHHKITTLDYDHIPYLSVVRDATVHLQSMEIKITPRKIAYIPGAGDEVPASLRQIGYQVDIMEADQLTPDVLAGYQVVILGVRAYNTVDALTYKNHILFDWVSEGGTLITQYNVSRGLVTEEVAPFPLSLSRDRVTEENAPVTILDPNHPAMLFPNKINQEDFKGWVQERGLYFPNKWDEHFLPLLEMNDTGEAPTKGALLVAPYGKGYYVYSGLSWFRHLPAGNPGPYRLLSNLISLGYKNGKS